MSQKYSTIGSKIKSFLAYINIFDIPRLAREISCDVKHIREKYDETITSIEKYKEALQLEKENRQKDILLQRTSYGIHKDDIQVVLDHVPFRSIASQGQRKSLLFAFKLAEYQTLVAHAGHSLLLLDDVFEKLDEGRMHNLLQWVCIKNSGQVFITDTHRERLEKTFNTLGLSAQIIEP